MEERFALRSWELYKRSGEVKCLSISDIRSIREKNMKTFQTILAHKRNINNNVKWDYAKKYTNEFEFVYTFQNEGISDLNVISRAFFKFVEICEDADLLKYALNNSSNGRIKAACICEAPGGFAQAIDYLCKRKHIQLQSIHAITLRSGTDRSVPRFRNSVLKSLRICYGADGTGNIYDLKNIDSFAAEVEKCDLVTADGGFDFSCNYDTQESDFQKMLISEIYTALRIQKQHGVFIIKLFDLFLMNTLRIISMLSNVYNDISVCKPLTSRPANSERYLVCKGYTRNPCIEQLFRNAIEDGHYKLPNVKSQSIAEKQMWNIEKRIFDMNQTFFKMQTNYIDRTINSLSNTFIRSSQNRHIRDCVLWCIHYNIPIKNEYKHIVETLDVNYDGSMGLTYVSTSSPPTLILA